MKMRIRPASPELKIPDPVSGKDLPVDGKVIEINDFWRRRIEAGEVKVENAKPKRKAKKANGDDSAGEAKAAQENKEG